MAKVKTYWANIYLGLGFEGVNGYDSWTYDQPEMFVKDYVTENPMCVTFTKTQFMYKDGYENGVIIGLINYPRFPKTHKEIQDYASKLAKELKKKFWQKRISIMFPDKTIMF